MSGGERKPRWWLRILWVVVIVGVLAGAAEFALRLIVPGVIQTAVRQQLGMPSNHEVDVSLGGSVLLGALRGGVRDVTIDVPDAPLIEGLAADAELHAAAVPFNPLSGEIEGATAKLTFTKDQLSPAVSLLTSGVADSGEVKDGALVVGKSLAVFGQEVPLTVSLGLSVDSGDVVVQPEAVNLADLGLDAAQISQATGGLLDPILQQRTVCVRDQLPRGVTLTNISLLRGGAAVVEAKLAPGLLSDDAEREKGTCE